VRGRLGRKPGGSREWMLEGLALGAHDMTRHVLDEPVISGVEMRARCICQRDAVIGPRPSIYRADC